MIFSFEGCFCKVLIIHNNLYEIPYLSEAGPGPLPTSKMELLMTILKLTTLVEVLVLVELLDLLLAKYDFLNILGSCFSRMENYLLGNIITEVGSRSLLKSNMELSVTIVVNLRKL